jgi:hypothetical protein
MEPISKEVFEKVRQTGNLIAAQFNRLETFLFDLKGNLIMPEPVERISPDYKGIYRVTLLTPNYNRIEGFINQSGEWIVEPNYHFVNQRYDRRDPDLKALLQIVKNRDGYGILDLDQNARISVPCRYHYIAPVPGSGAQLYIARLDGKYGIIDVKGNVIHPLQHTRLEIDNIIEKQRWSETNPFGDE